MSDGDQAAQPTSAPSVLLVGPTVTYDWVIPLPDGLHATDLIPVDASLWVIAEQEGGGNDKLLMIDAGLGELFASADISGNLVDLAATDEHVWIADTAGSVVHQIDRSNGEAIATVTLPNLPEASGFQDRMFLPFRIAASGDNAWVASGRGYLSQLNVENATAREAIPLRPGTIADLAMLNGDALVAQDPYGVHRVDAVTLTLASTFSYEYATTALIAGRDGIWVLAADLVRDEDGVLVERDGGYVLSDEGGALLLLDPDSGLTKVAIPMQQRPQFGAENDVGLWVIDSRGSIHMADLASGTLIPSGQVVENVVGLSGSGESLWVATSDPKEVIRLRTTRN